MENLTAIYNKNSENRSSMCVGLKETFDIANMLQTLNTLLKEFCATDSQINNIMYFTENNIILFIFIEKANN